MSFEKIAVIGLGYIGLPTAAMFASRKKQVIGIDVSKNTVDTINRGEIHIVEPDLDGMVHVAVKDGFLRATLTPEEADAFLIAVPTPFLNDNETDIPQPDLSYIEAATKAIAPCLKKGALVILESTSPVGATEKLADWLSDCRPDLSFPQAAGEDADVNIAHCPERVLPGQVVRELVENDRIIGGISIRCSERAVELYKTFVKGECVVTNARTAEMAKLTENSCRDVQIAFANELSIICEKLDIDVWELIELSNRHPRINILQPGPGVGGHCIAVDPWFIVSKTPELAQLISTARRVNDSKPKWVLDKIKAVLADFLLKNQSIAARDVSIACYGLAFKPDIDDLRESPSVDIVKELAMYHEGPVYAVEPHVSCLPSELVDENVSLVSFEQSLTADIKVLLVDHSDFKSKSIDSNYLLDTKGIWK